MVRQRKWFEGGRIWPSGRSSKSLRDNHTKRWIVGKPERGSEGGQGEE